MNLPGMTPFLEACDSTGPLVLGTASTRFPTSVDHILHQPFAVIGRAPHADLVLASREISKRHAYLQVLDGRAFLLDLDRRTEVSFDGRLTKAGWLNPGQTLRFGPFTVSLKEGCRESSNDFNPLVSRTREHQGLPAVGLSFPKEASEKRVWFMNCRLALVGESPLCKVRLCGPSVSRFHCSLVRTPAGLYVIDLVGRGGIQVNGRQVRYALVRPGDRLQVGHFEIEVIGEAIRPNSPEDTHTPESSSSLPALRPVSAFNASPHNLPSNATVLPPAEAYSESLLQQFDSMQNQMVSQFQQAMVRMVQMFGKTQQEEMAHLHAELSEMRAEQLTHIQGELKQLRQEEMGQLHGQLSELRNEERGRIHEGLKELRERERGHIHEGLKELREEERGRIHEGLKELREEEVGRIHERLKELREEERGRIQERLKQLREEERDQIHEGLKELREEERVQIHNRLNELREQERGQMQQQLKGLREEQMAHIQEDLKELREEERAKIQEGLKELREEERAQVRQELQELHKVNRELQELRAQIAAAPQPVSESPRSMAFDATSEDAALDLRHIPMETLAAAVSAPVQANIGNREPPPAAALPAEAESARAEPVAQVSELEPTISNAPAPSTVLPDAPVGAPSRPPAAGPSSADHEDLHAKLCVRMATLQDERQSRWRKILGLLSGGGRDR